MKQILKYTIQGCGYLPGYGYHPGSKFLVFFIILGALAGSSRENGTIIGGMIIVLLFGPLYLVGAYLRAKEYNNNGKNHNSIK